MGVGIIKKIMVINGLQVTIGTKDSHSWLQLRYSYTKKYLPVDTDDI